jgi:hypothetical protein
MKIGTLNNNKARIVLGILEEMTDDDNSRYLALHSYSNCREQGFCLETTFSTPRRWVAFSECRNSDSIVVYTDTASWVGGLTDESYKNVNYFNYNAYTQAAEYIHNLLESTFVESEASSIGLILHQPS